MVTALQIAGLSVTAVLIAKLLSRYAAEQALMLTLLLGILLTCSAAAALAPVLNQIDTLLEASGLDSAQTARIGKAIGICILTQLGGDICKDAGESALCTAITFAGKAALLLLILPLIPPILTLIREVLSCVA